MAKQLSMGSSRIWINNADPGVSETSINQGNLWYNTSNNLMFICIDDTLGAQVWKSWAYGNSSGILPIATGGSNASSYSVTNGLLYYDGTRVLSNPTGSLGQFVCSNGSDAPYSLYPGGILNLVNNVNSKNTGQTLIFAVPSGVTFYPQSIRVVCSAASAITVPAIISIGTTAGSYIDILPLTALAGLTGANGLLNLPISALVSTVAANTPIYVNVGTAATGASQTLSVHIIGSYI